MRARTFVRILVAMLIIALLSGTYLIVAKSNPGTAAQGDPASGFVH